MTPSLPTYGSPLGIGPHLSPRFFHAGGYGL